MKSVLEHLKCLEEVQEVRNEDEIKRNEGKRNAHDMILLLGCYGVALAH